MVDLCSRHPRSRAVRAGNPIHTLLPVILERQLTLLFYLTFYINILTNISTKRAVLQYGLETKKRVNDKELPECFLASLSRFVLDISWREESTGSTFD